MKYFSLFTGIGGFELGIQQAYESLCNANGGEVGGSQSNTQIDQGQGLLTTQREDISTKKRPASERATNRAHKRPLCVGYSEIDKYAIQIYQKHFPNHTNYGDIKKINERDLPEFELLVGGFPCQSFSIAGKRGGFEDTRGTLFFDIARIAKEKQPRLLLLENVKGLLSHDQGRTFRTIITTLDELGYDLQWQVLNSKNHGVPQNRERVFIIGHLRGTPRPQIFPFGGADDEDNGTRQVSSTINAGGGGQGAKTGLYAIIPEATKQGYAMAEEGDSINLSVPNSKTRRGRVGKGIAQTIDTGMQQHTLTSDMKIRRLTPVECERLQGFPDNWTEYGGYIKAETITDKHPEHMPAFEKISDTQRYKCCGNAVTVNVIRDICERLLYETL